MRPIARLALFLELVAATGLAVSAGIDGEVRQQSTTIHRGDRHELVFCYDVAADTLPPSGGR